MMSLRAFEAAARHLSFTRAALELSLTPTAVSHQIRNLEDLLGARLFVRNNNTLALTETAENYLGVVREAILDLSFATDRVAERKDERLLTVQCLETFAIKRLLPHLRGFHRLHPEFSIRLRTGHSLDATPHHQFDVAIWNGVGAWPGTAAHRLGAEEVFPVCSPRLLAAGTPLRRPDDLRLHTVIRTTSLVLRDEWPMWLEAAGASGIEFGEQLSCNYLATSINAAEEGLGVVLGRTSVVERDLAAGRLVEPFDVRITSAYSYYLVIPEHSGQTEKVKVFSEWLLSHLGQPCTARPPAPSRTRQPVAPRIRARASISA